MIVTRYNIKGTDAWMEENDTGGYVSYDDYEALSNKLDDLINAADESEQTLIAALNRAVKE
jgi:hypothetical protein